MGARLDGELVTLPRRATRELLALQSSILARAAAGTHVDDLLDPLCRMIEDAQVDTTCTILVVEGPVLRHAAAPGMPTVYTEEIDGVEWGPDCGSCGTTVHTGLPTLVDDIATDPRWTPWRELALGLGFRACWSVPVRNRRGDVIATFAAYSSTPRMPDETELEILEHASNLVSVLLEQQRDRDRLLALTADLEATNAELLAANRAKDDFLSMTSHELRTPLTPMIGMIETLQERWDQLPDDDRRGLLDVMGRQAVRLQHLVEDLLMMSAVQAGELRAFAEDVTVQPAVVEAVLAMVGPDLPVTIDVPEDLAAHVDPRHLQQMLQNYLSNAMKYAEGGPTRVGAAQEGDQVVVRVEDRGDGVPTHLVDELFDLFTQLDHGDRRTAKGTGIGLAVVRALASLNEGRAWYEPAEGGGACFAISLPAATG